MNQNAQIDVSVPLEHFNAHLLLEENKRIIFSGRFGIGKTYFIKKYYKKKESEICLVYLKPVNYSIASNEDIFRLIKYDIILSLEKENAINWEKLDFSKLEYLPFYLTENAEKIFNQIISPVTKLDPTVASAATAGRFAFKVSKLFGSFQEKYKNVNISSEEKEYYNFVKQSSSNFLLVENDLITGVIIAAIQGLKKENGGEYDEVHLVIDDLDRVDPEHVFRLFNIFSAHLDDRSFGNVFGFEKVVFVCDINNIRKIFSARYGEQVDFNGYIDRFFSSHIYEFENTKSLLLACSDYMSFLGRGILIDRFFAAYHAELSFKILSIFIRSGKLNLRKVVKFLNVNPENWPHDLGRKYVPRKFDPATPTITFLSWIFGGEDELLNAIDELIDYEKIQHHEQKFWSMREDSEYFLDLLRFAGYISSNSLNQKVHVNDRVYDIDADSDGVRMRGAAVVWSDSDILFVLRKIINRPK